MLLTRDAFRETVFARDGFRCVLCGERGRDAHHIIERRLWPDGGYYVDNGATLCGPHHLDAETTRVSPEEIRRAAGITKVVVPPHLYPDHLYDKWGNAILPNGQRMTGELFHDESVQKILREGGMLGQFTDYVKYPRTYHLPWSPGVTDDDRILSDLSGFEGKEVVVTEKMDGENTSLYYNGIHARSLDGRSHPSRDWVKNFWNKHVGWKLPVGWRVCGENLYAKHSIRYDDLESYFLGFSVWDEYNDCLDWDDTLVYLQTLDITPVREIYRGPWDERLIREIEVDTARQEGYVVRTSEKFSYKDFRRHVAKWVRAEHVQTGKHWFYGQSIEPNQMKET